MEELVFSCLFSPFKTNAILSKHGQKVLKREPKSKQLTLDASFTSGSHTIAQTSQRPDTSPLHDMDVQDKEVDDPAAQDVDVDGPAAPHADVDENMGNMSGKDSTHDLAQGDLNIDTDSVPSIVDGSATDASQDVFMDPPFTQHNPSVSTSDDDIHTSEWEPTQSPKWSLVLMQLNNDTDGGMAVDDNNGGFSSIPFYSDRRIAAYAVPCVPVAIIPFNHPLVGILETLIHRAHCTLSMRGETTLLCRCLDLLSCAFLGVRDRDKSSTGEALDSITDEIRQLNLFLIDTHATTPRPVVPTQKRVPAVISPPRAPNRKKCACINTAGESSKPPSLPPPPPPQSSTISAPSASSSHPTPLCRILRRQHQRTSPLRPIDESDDADLLADALNAC
ncbi:hypothetical protein JVT61DRAFT_3943 [Boletus reticuloceps]|uniref:Uncharacterized protein n=1 Tax=Boletus reticuloceps TaxID=495285 RepID=A0A8I2YPC2_9AGAM|nr:hypothetical protein JVT61DRAFT_3943 [Boletus reticuloceps]